MLNRIFKVYGKGIGAIPASVVATVNDETVYSGSVFTNDIPFSTAIKDSRFLFQFELPPTKTGTFSTTFAVTEGSVFFCIVRSNLGWVPNPIYSAEEYDALVSPGTSSEVWAPIYNSRLETPLTQEEIDILSSTNPADYGSQLYLLRSKGIDPSKLDSKVITSTFEGHDITDPYYIDDVLQPARTNLWPGQINLEVAAGSTLRFDLKI